MQQILRGNYDAALRQLNGAKTAGGAPAEVENLRGLALLDSTGLAVLLEAAHRGARVRGAEGAVLRLLQRTRTLEIFGVDE